MSRTTIITTTTALFILLSTLLLFTPEAVSAAVNTSGQPQVELSVEPETPQADSEPAALTFQVTDENGAPVEGVQIEARMEHIQGSSWTRLFPTDYPVTEGTRQFSVSSVVNDGTFRIDRFHFFPRGTYRVEAQVSPVDGGASFEPVSQTFTVPVTEKPVEIRNAILLLLGLAVLGGLIGYVYADRLPGPENRPTSEVAASIIMALFLTATALAMPNLAAAHGDGEGSITPVQTSENLSVEADHDPIVGEPVRLDIRVNQASAAVDSTPFSYDLWLVPEEELTEEEMTQPPRSKAVFATTASSFEPQTSLSYHFMDGAPHRLGVNITRAGQPVAQGLYQIGVEAVQPPLTTVLKGLLWLLIAYLIGMGAGIRLKRRRAAA